MRKLISLLLITLSLPLMAGELDLIRVDKTKFPTPPLNQFREDSRQYLKARNWRHPAELWNEINYDEATYFYVVCDPDIKNSSVMKGVMNKNAAEVVTTISYDNKGFARDTAEWELYQTTLRDYNDTYSPNYDVEVSTN